jgi:hypothetical protein
MDVLVGRARSRTATTTTTTTTVTTTTTKEAAALRMRNMAVDQKEEDSAMVLQRLSSSSYSAGLLYQAFLHNGEYQTKNLQLSTLKT